MTLEEILAAMSNLKPEELEAIDSKLCELERKEVREWIERAESEPPLPPGYWKEVFRGWTATGGDDDLPADFSYNFGHYVYGTPKR